MTRADIIPPSIPPSIHPGVHQGRDITRELRLRADACVIGSGAGGAVVAARLAEAGMTVVVLEEGGYWPPESFSEREDEMLPALYVEGGQRTTKDFLINVLQGRLVGGSTVINMVDNTRIPMEVIAHWAQAHAVEGVTEAELEPHYQAVERAIHSGPIAPHLINEANARLEKAAQRLGWAGEYMRTNRKGCIGSGYCLLGCRYNAKQSALITFIPRALAAGAKVYADVEAVRLVEGKGRIVRIEARVLDRATRRPTGVMVTVEAALVVLAAGTVNSAALLLRSKVANRSGQVGKNLSLQPQIPVVAQFDAPMRSWRGAMQSYAITEFERHGPDWGMGGYRIEAMFSQPGLASGYFSGFGAPHLKAMEEYEKLGGVLVLCPDQPSGEVKVKGEKQWLDYRMTDELRARMMRGVAHSAEAFFAAGALTVTAPFEEETVFTSLADTELLASRRLEPGRIQLLSAHPQGTCRMGEDPASAVVNSWGRSHDIPNLWLADASTHPTSAASHTMIPIMALAHRTAAHIVENAHGDK